MKKVKFVKLQKIKEVNNPLHANNIEPGYIIYGIFNEKPIVGRSFIISYNFATSTVKEIINKTTFKTYNSIYKWYTFKFDKIVKMKDFIKKS